MDFNLNDEQRKIVEGNLEVINKVINKYIHINNGIYGMEYDDIFQVGTIGLCKAAVNYKESSSAKFDTYAFKVIKNEIYDYLKEMVRKNNSRDKYLLLVSDRFYISNNESVEDDIYSKTAYEALNKAKMRYSGSALTGIEALELKIKGYKGSEIASKFHMGTNNITACISRAKKYLRKDKEFLKSIT